MFGLSPDRGTFRIAPLSSTTGELNHFGSHPDPGENAQLLKKACLKAQYYELTVSINYPQET